LEHESSKRGSRGKLDTSDRRKWRP